MQAISEVLPQVLRRRGVPEIDPSAPEEIELRLLEQPLLPAAQYEAWLAHLQASLNTDLEPTSRREVIGEIGVLQRKLTLAQLRESLQLGRPSGCWCYGLGGMRKRYLRMTTNDLDEEPEFEWQIPCSCPESLEQQARVARVRQQRRARLAQKHAEALYGSLPARFQPFTFETLTKLSPPHRATIKLFYGWVQDPKRWALVFRGPTGVAKTGMGVPVLKQALAMDLSALYIDVVIDFLARLRSSYNSAEALAESGDAQWEALHNIDVLLIDDLGAERHRKDGGNGPDWATEMLWQVIAKRHRDKRKTIITTNHSLQELTAMFGHARISSRLAEESLLIDCSSLPVIREPG